MRCKVKVLRNGRLALVRYSTLLSFSELRILDATGPGRMDFVDFFFGNPTFGKEDEVDHDGEM